MACRPATNAAYLPCAAASNFLASKMNSIFVAAKMIARLAKLVSSAKSVAPKGAVHFQPMATPCEDDPPKSAQGYPNLPGPFVGGFIMERTVRALGVYRTIPMALPWAANSWPFWGEKLRL